jgi:hypothetical protein
MTTLNAAAGTASMIEAKTINLVERIRTVRQLWPSGWNLTLGARV